MSFSGRTKEGVLISQTGSRRKPPLATTGKQGPASGGFLIPGTILVRVCSRRHTSTKLASSPLPSLVSAYLILFAAPCGRRGTEALGGEAT